MFQWIIAVRTRGGLILKVCACAYAYVCVIGSITWLGCVFFEVLPPLVFSGLVSYTNQTL